VLVIDIALDQWCLNWVRLNP